MQTIIFIIMEGLRFKKLLVFLAICLISTSLMSQVPEMFNYQAVARDIDHNPIASTNMNVKIAILFSSPTGTVLWEEQHSVLTSEEGIFSIKVGDPDATRTGGTIALFPDIEWQLGNMFIRPSIEYQGNWYQLDASQLVTVPYALVAQKAEIGQFPVNGDVIYLPTGGSLAIGSDDSGGSKLAVISEDDASEEALFEVKRADGQTVFAVYPESVRVYVSKGDPEGKAPGSRGGFAVAGFDRDKATPLNDLLWLTPDSVRFYIDDTQTTGKAPGSRGGFAVAGFDRDKATPGVQYMSISGSDVPDVIQPSSQILFYPRKDAFMAGYIAVEDPVLVGQNSTSIGYLNIASGNFSQAFGFQSEASADYAMAVGNSAEASGESSFAFGEGATASGGKSYALGFYSSAIGTQTYAIGKNSYASGNEAMAMGFYSRALAMNSLAMGAYSEARNERSTAIGYDAVTNADFSLSIGYQSSTSGNGASAIGYQSTAGGIQSTALAGGSSGGDYSFSAGLGSKSNGLGAVSIGQFNEANANRAIVLGSWGQANGSASGWYGTDHLLVIGNGNGAYSNAMEVLKNGNVGIGAEPGDYKLFVAGNIRATEFTTTSDISLKTNINQIAGASDKIMRIKGVSFDFRTEDYPEMGLPGGTHYGVIAQDLQEILPDMVNEGSDGKLSVAYTELIPILLEAFKEQEMVISDRENRIIDLEAENAEIKARLAALEAAVGSMLEKQQ